jgi:LPXTG-motif cell wall-anchored protein
MVMALLHDLEEVAAQYRESQKVAPAWVRQTSGESNTPYWIIGALVLAFGGLIWWRKRSAP